MFTVKFIKTDSEGQVTRYVASRDFDIYERGPGNFDVNTYPEKLSEPGTCWHVSDHPNGWDHCYVENQAGKTIAHCTAVYGVTQKSGEVNC